MRKELTELVFILDRSGSMMGLEKDTIGGFNSMIEKQKKQPGQVLVTTVLFDGNYELIHNRVPLEKIEPLTENDYYARGCTALLDAVGKTIQRVINVKRNAAYRTKADKVIFVITTDGMENASIEYSYAMIQSMIERQRERYGWEFLFLGANIDAVSEAGRMGIKADRAVRFNNDTQGIKTNYRVLEDTVCMMRSVEDTSVIGDEWKSDIEDDYKRRK